MKEMIEWLENAIAKEEKMLICPAEFKWGSLNALKKALKKAKNIDKKNCNK